MLMGQAGWSVDKEIYLLCLISKGRTESRTWESW